MGWTLFNVGFQGQEVPGVEVSHGFPGNLFWPVSELMVPPDPGVLQVPLRKPQVWPLVPAR